MNYEQFLEEKAVIDVPTGIDIDASLLNPMLNDFQRDIVKWALRRGRAAVFADCGLGKSFMQLEWAHHVPGDVLIAAPLAVGPQTVEEAAKFNIPDVHFGNDGHKLGKITITNFDNVHKYNADDFAGIVLDESSILKNSTGKTRTAFIEQWAKTPFRLACTATPSPNDFVELGNHGEFLGVAKFDHIKSEYFIHDSGDVKQKWRLKGHAKTEFFKWVAQWAVYIRQPQDIGYNAKGYDLPALNIHEVIVDTPNNSGFLFQMPATDLQSRIQARRETISERAQAAVDLINSKGGRWVVWCNLNSEADAIRKLCPDIVEVRGSDKDDKKAANLMGFSHGEINKLVTKPSVAGFGMNWQDCHQVAFVGLSDSYEQYYQAIRRCWRFGQKNPVDAYLIVSDREGAVLENIKRKDKQMQELTEEMRKNMTDLTKSQLGGGHQNKKEYKTDYKSGKGWEAYQGDCVEVVSSLPSDSIHYSIFSPPFASLYMFSNTDRDMSNVKSHEEFFNHFGFLVEQLHRVMMSGRLVSIHCCNLPKSKNHDGVIGIYDFRGDVIRLFERYGFVFHSEVTIWKDPVVAMQRTKAIGLLHKQVMKDSAMSRQGIPDYLVTMRKIGDNPEPIKGKFTQFSGSDEFTPEQFKQWSNRGYYEHGWGDVDLGEGDTDCVNEVATADMETRHSIDIWQRYASPVWMDIRQGDVLKYKGAKADKDEKHITPLQLGVIERGIDLWTNPGDTVLSPFMGIGSEGYVALQKSRKFIGAELKESYYSQAVKNLTDARQASDAVLPGLEAML